MADEWSKPVKHPEFGWWECLKGPESDPYKAMLSDEGLFAHDGLEGIYCPRDVVLRLLAAEASDRLGWVWEVDTGDWIASGGKSMWGRHAETGEPITYDDHFGFTDDDLLASLMGRFLLADALREAQ